MVCYQSFHPDSMASCDIVFDHLHLIGYIYTEYIHKVLYILIEISLAS